MKFIDCSGCFMYELFKNLKRRPIFSRCVECKKKQIRGDGDLWRKRTLA